MGIQTVIDSSNSLEINRRKLVGIQYTRNEISRTSVTPTLNPWRFTLTLPNNLKYSDARSLLEEIDSLDRVLPETVYFGHNDKLSWIFKYQGDANLQVMSAVTVTSFIGNQLILSNLPNIGAGNYLFRKNDIIQIYGYPYPFSSTTDVVRGASTSVTVVTHRPNFIPYTITDATITVGQYANFNLFCPNMPTYKLIPGGGTYDTSGNIINNAYIEWSSEFKLYEYLGQI